ncbi:hypothetical protein GCM10009753_65210 [Streptantibioticus ferralitis]
MLAVASTTNADRSGRPGPVHERAVPAVVVSAAEPGQSTSTTHTCGNEVRATVLKSDQLVVVTSRSPSRLSSAASADRNR